MLGPHRLAGVIYLAKETLYAHLWYWLDDIVLENEFVGVISLSLSYILEKVTPE